MNKISAITLASLMAAATQAQVIDPLTGSLSGYTTYLVNDASLGAGQGVSFTDSASGLQANYVGTGTSAEQALFLAPASSFSTTFAVGDTLSVSTVVPVSSTAEDFGLAISDAHPTAATSGVGWNSRTNFDWMSISIRPSQTSIRQNTDIGGSATVPGTLTTGSFVMTGVSASSVNGLYISWVSADVFTLGYINSSDVEVPDDTVTFEGGSTIGTEIGFYADLRATGTSLGDFSNLTIQPIPEPATIALCSVGGFLGLAGWMRRRK